MVKYRDVKTLFLSEHYAVYFMTREKINDNEHVKVLDVKKSRGVLKVYIVR
jgi:hypothetical protein